MQYCTEKELNDLDIVHAYLGNPFKEPGKLLTVTGSGVFHRRFNPSQYPFVGYS